MSRRTQKNVGVVGLGIIGQRVADCLRRRGFHVFVWNRTPRPFPNFVGSPAELAELCDFIQIFVSNNEALLQMVNEMKRSLNAHHIVMAHSTVSPEAMREAADIVQRRGGQLLDAPFTGSKEAAGRGELVYYVGGDEAAYRRARPVLEASSKEIIGIGEVGQATVIKVATNMITAATVQVAAEALALVDRAGISLEKFATAMRSNGSNSGTLTMKLPKMLSGDYETHFSVKHMLKDVRIASEMARDQGLRLPVTEMAKEALQEEASRGHGDRDYSAVAAHYFPEPPAPELNLLPEVEEEAETSPIAEAETFVPAEEEQDAPASEAASPEDATEPEVVAIVEVQEEAEIVSVAPAEEESAPSNGASASAETAPAPEEPGEERRGFFRRIFNRMDY